MNQCFICWFAGVVVFFPESLYSQRCRVRRRCVVSRSIKNANTQKSIHLVCIVHIYVYCWLLVDSCWMGGWHQHVGYGSFCSLVCSFVHSFIHSFVSLFVNGKNKNQESTVSYYFSACRFLVEYCGGAHIQTAFYFILVSMKTYGFRFFGLYASTRFYWH